MRQSPAHKAQEQVNPHLAQASHAGRRAQAKSFFDQERKYTPVYAFQLISIMADGHSVTAAAAKMDVHRDKVNEWARQHPEFAEAVKRAMGVRLYRLETDLMRATKSSVVRAHMFMLKHASPEEWGGKGGDTPVKTPLQEVAEQLKDARVFRPVENVEDNATENVGATALPETQIAREMANGT